MLKLALTVRWMAALLFCLSLAAGFALMAQWQIGRTFIENAANETWSKVETVNLSEIAEPNSPFRFGEISTVNEETVLTKVTTSLTLDPSKTVLVANRIQVNGNNGYWLVVPAQNSEAKLFVVAGFISEEKDEVKILAQVKQLLVIQALVPVTGRYLPSEAPVESLGGSIFYSLSIAQQINLSSFESEQVYTGFIALTEENVLSSVEGVELVTIGMPKSDSQVNWLSAFYAIEWTVFAGFAVFMWWRLLADAYKKQQLALVSS